MDWRQRLPAFSEAYSHTDSTSAKASTPSFNWARWCGGLCDAEGARCKSAIFYHSNQHCYMFRRHFQDPLPVGTARMQSSLTNFHILLKGTLGKFPVRLHLAFPWHGVMIRYPLNVRNAFETAQQGAPTVSLPPVHSHLHFLIGCPPPMPSP